ncbi:electron transport complex subunit RsxC [Salinimonas sediminis]|uniref:Ion-translocating oxidoreductase complex subunit C n=1 Tax=Salinimonas sediminis TaxID=2303538 RepID=A0A346NK23_9ALTE|nr:electron transport complex subunit RsxC [Salinimonas sediminis]AXR05880.1 electron transport complex subunit RsxC [Salinimonas sediminis]
MYPDYDTVVEKLATGKRYLFPGGVHPQDRKQLSNQSAISRPALPDELIVPVRQHIGTQGRLSIAVGDYVKKGQPLTSSAHPFAIPVHAPTSGTILAISDRVVAHPSGLSELTITLIPDGLESWYPLQPLAQYKDLPPAQVVEALCDAGISGMGGAGFPTHIKAAGSKTIEFMIINGAECEPYITADDRLMREHAWQVRQGIDVLQHLIAPKMVLVAVEDNKPEAIKALRIACQDKPGIQVVSVETKYPAGGEKQLIQTLTGREVPREGLPADIGIVMFNVGTCYAVADAVFQGKPLIERVVTLTGEALDAPQNVWALVGTPVNHLLGYAGYNARKQQLPQVIMGGPMMGFTLNDAQVPVVKITNCILVPADGELTQGEDERACIRCSACADACPASLLPQQLYWHAKAAEYEKAEEYDLFDCIECGACAYVCPSEIPLVHYYRQAKSSIRLERDEKAKAEKAKERFEARKARLEREKLEREEKHRKAKEARAAASSSASARPTASASAATQANSAAATDSAPKDRVAAVLARAKAKKAAQQQAASPAPDNNTPAAEPGASQAVNQQPDNSNAPAGDSNQPVDDKKAKVAAAVARAKAKKAAQQGDISDAAGDSNLPEDGPTDDKKAKVAAAVARAKAKKAALQQAASPAPDNNTPAAELGASQTVNQQPDNSNAPAGDSNQPVDDKKAKVAAAVARAKAKKAAQQQAASPAPDNNTPAAEPGASQAVNQQPDNSNAPAGDSNQPVDDKKAKVAAAVARAKAKKAAQQQAASPAPDNNTPAAEPGASQAVEQQQEASSAPADDSQAPADDNHTSGDGAADNATQKQQRIAAAIAKAKAKKAAKDNAGEVPPAAPPHADTAKLDAQQQKQQRIAAAVAKAKAKKAARDNTPDENNQ